ncbi:MAG: HAMP domain-containing sensor histidine kinase [Lachnospiraceae bacterium]
MTPQNAGQEYKVRQSLFSMSLFCNILLTILLVSGIHTGLMVLFSQIELHGGIATIIIIAYWFVIAINFTLFIRYQIRKIYEIPMKELAEAANAVAHGNFSVYLPVKHTAERLDYLDVMIMDFNKMVEELGSIETLKTDFFSNVSHEIKTPLAVILNYAQSLQNPGLPEELKQEYIKTIIQSSRKLSGLISNILKLSKLEKQNIQPVAEAYDVCEQLCECVLQFEALWEERQIELEADLEDRVSIEADASLLELVWNNLLSNAVKFTEPGGTVSVKQTSTSDEVIVSVSDTGCGMTKETMNHIFDKFYQGDTSHSVEGNGLGLALAFRVIELTGGTLSVESELGKGTRFTVRLPVNRGSI